MKLKRKFYKDMVNDEYLHCKWRQACEDLRKRKQIRCVVQKKNGELHRLETLKIVSDAGGMMVIVR